MKLLRSTDRSTENELSEASRNSVRGADEPGDALQALAGVAARQVRRGAEAAQLPGDAVLAGLLRLRIDPGLVRR